MPKEAILSWIGTYYSDELIITRSAERSFRDDKRNIDWHKFCMMIHYLAGYTKYRNNGGLTFSHDAAREYDPEDASYRVEPSSSGQGATEMYKKEYTISCTDADGKQMDVLLDLHLKAGKGKDTDMIRIYFAYSRELQRSIIGYMPEHLPTRKSNH